MARLARERDGSGAGGGDGGEGEGKKQLTRRLRSFVARLWAIGFPTHLPRETKHPWARWPRLSEPGNAYPKRDTDPLPSSIPEPPDSQGDCMAPSRTPAQG